MVSRSSIEFIREALVDVTFIRNSRNWCKTIVGSDASHLYLFSMCEAMPTGLYTRSGKFKLRQNKTKSFENIVMSYFQRFRPQCKMESFHTTVTEERLMHTVLMAFVDTAALRLKLWDSFINIAHVKKFVHLSLRKKFSEVLKRES